MSDKVLIIDDDPDLVDALVKQISGLGLTPEACFDGQSGLEKALSGDYALVILDIMIPKLEGVEVCKRIRAADKYLPVIMLSARADEVSKVLLLELGADDYITKPFSADELKARIKTVLRRASNEHQHVETEKLVIGELVIDFVKRKLLREDFEVELSAGEFDLLAMLASKPGRPFTREEINEFLFGYNVEGYDDNVTRRVNRIRAKIEKDPANPEIILTVRGVGYKFAEIKSE